MLCVYHLYTLTSPCCQPIVRNIFKPLSSTIFYKHTIPWTCGSQSSDQSTVFWVITLWSSEPDLSETNASCFLLAVLRHHEDWSDMFPRNVSLFPNYMALQNQETVLVTLYHIRLPRNLLRDIPNCKNCIVSSANKTDVEVNTSRHFVTFPATNQQTLSVSTCNATV